MSHCCFQLEPTATQAMVNAAIRHSRQTTLIAESPTMRCCQLELIVRPESAHQTAMLWAQQWGPAMVHRSASAWAHGSVLG